MKDAALYLEVDEDITSAIDKLTKTDGTSVQIVAPKRSTMLQSIINLKLLKKAAADAGKELVLVTNDKVTGDLAGRVGLAVAPSIGAKPVLAAPVPAKAPQNDDIIEDDGSEDAPPVPAPAAIAPPPAIAPKRPPLFSRKAVEEAQPATTAVGGAVAGAAADKTGPKVPDFNLMRRRMLWIGLAVVLIAGYVAAMALFTKATVTLYATGSKTQIDTNFMVDTDGQTDAAAGVVAGQAVTSTKDLSGSFAPTGQKDAGTKASGQMSVRNEYDASPHTLTAGTRFAAPDGKIFRTNDDVTVPGATPIISGGKLSLQAGTANVGVTADTNGDAYNEAPARYTIVAYSGDMQAKIYGQGAQMSGGTSKIVTVVSQDDIDKAKADLLAKDKDASSKNLSGKVPSGYRAIPDSLVQTATGATSSPALGQEGSTATLTVPVSYNVLTVKNDDFSRFIQAIEQAQIGKDNQIYDDGIGTAQISSSGKDAKGRASFKFSTEAYGGLKLDTEAIKAQIKGKRYGDALDIAGKQVGVQRAEVVIKPAWATGVPNNTKKINVIIQVADSKE